MTKPSLVATLAAVLTNPACNAEPTVERAATLVAHNAASDGGALQNERDAETATLSAVDAASPVEPATSAPAGCNAADWPQTGAHTVLVGNLSREFVVTLPEGYDPQHEYRLVLAWHGKGGNAQGTANHHYGLPDRAKSTTIFVAGSGLGTDEEPVSTAWRNEDGRDVAFARALLDWLKQNYCVDSARVFSVGFSWGGVMSNTVGCAMGDSLRAVAVIAGRGPNDDAYNALGDEPACRGEVAVWLTHGTADGVVPFEHGESSRDYWASRNGCAKSATATSPSEHCVAQAQCNDEAPVHWCEHAGAHGVPAFSSDAVWNFFSQF